MTVILTDEETGSGNLLVGLGLGLILGMRLGPGPHLFALLPSFLIVVDLVSYPNERKLKNQPDLPAGAVVSEWGNGDRPEG